MNYRSVFRKYILVGFLGKPNLGCYSDILSLYELSFDEEKLKSVLMCTVFSEIESFPMQAEANSLLTASRFDGSIDLIPRSL